LYHDRHNKQSQPLPLQVRVTIPKKAKISKRTGKRSAESFGSKSISCADTNLSTPPEPKLLSSPYETQFTFNNYPKNRSTGKNEVPTVQLTTPQGVPLTRKDTSMSNMSSDTIAIDAMTPYEDLDTEGLMQEQHRTQSNEKESRLSWTVTLGSMVIATIVSKTGPRHTEISFVDDHFRL